jgi:hypothetical protein
MTLRNKLLNECEVVRDNCEYIAESHYLSAKRAEKTKYIFEIIPAALSAISGILTGAGFLPDWTIWFSVFSASVAAISGVLDPSKKYRDFSTAGHTFTALKHKARFLKEVLSETLTDQELTKATQSLHEEYTTTIKMTPLTEEDMFKKGSEKIKVGVHKQDNPIS